MFDFIAINPSHQHTALQLSTLKSLAAQSSFPAFQLYTSQGHQILCAIVGENTVWALTPETSQNFQSCILIFEPTTKCVQNVTLGSYY